MNTILPDDILDIIFLYKKQLDLTNIVLELKNSKQSCTNCTKNKICMYKCNTCTSNICYECRYKDLNEEIVDQNTFQLFYKCDNCDMYDYCWDIHQHSEDEDEEDYEYDYYNEDRYARSWSDIF